MNGPIDSGFPWQVRLRYALLRLPDGTLSGLTFVVAATLLVLAVAWRLT